MKNYNFFKAIVLFLQAHKKSKVLRAIMLSLASYIVFTTTYTLILPALTLEQNKAEQTPGIVLENDTIKAKEDAAAEDEVLEDAMLEEEMEADEHAEASTKSAETSKKSTDYLVDDENGISDDEWETLLGEGIFFVEDETDETDLKEAAETTEAAQEAETAEMVDTVAGEVSQTETESNSQTEKEEAAEIVAETEAKTAVEKVTEAAAEAPAEKATEAVAEAPAEKATEAAAEASAEKGTEAAAGTPAEEVTEAAVKTAVEEATEAVVETAVEETTESVTESAEEEATKAVTEEITEAVTEVATEEETEAVTKAATEEETEAANKEITKEETEPVTEEVTEVMTEAATEEVTEETTEAATEDETEEMTEAVTEEVTEEATEVAAEEVTEAITEEVTEEVTEEPTEAVTEELTEAITEEITETFTEEVSEQETEEITEEETETAAEEIPEEITEAATEEETVEYVEQNYPAQHFEVYTKYMYIEVVADEGAFPEGTTITIEDIEDEETIETISSAVEGDIVRLHAVDITFRDAKQNEIEPLIPIRVTMTELDSDNAVSEQELTDLSENADGQEEKPVIVHLQQNGETQLVETSDETTEQADSQAVAFESDSFSVYALVYTVDFHWEVDGKTYEFSIPGGGYIALSDLVGILGIVDQDAENKAEQTTRFMADVENVVFSAPELMSVSRVEEDTTVGAIKDRLGLVCENSALLKAEALKAINDSEIEAGDWALISVTPFETEESLTLTLKDGKEFSIRVTDAQLRKTIISADGNAYEITVSYFGTAQIPDGAELKVREILKGDADYDEYCRKAIAKAKESGNSDDVIVGADDSDADGTVKTTGAVSEDEDLVEAVSKQTSEKPGKTYTTTSEMPEIDEIADYARFFDIEIWADGEKVEPQSDVSVTISLADVPEDRSSDPQIVHFGKNGSELMEAEEQQKIVQEAAVTELSFTTDGFSVYAIIVIDDYNGIFTLNGEDFTVKISYTEAAELPLGTVMTVRELEQNSEEFLRRLGETWAELNQEYLEVEEMRANYNEGMGLLPEANPVNVDSVRFFDISFDYKGEPIEPKVPVLVEITYDKGLDVLNAEEPIVGVAHFDEEGIEMIGDVQTTLDEDGDVKTFRYEQLNFSDTGTYVAQETKIEKAAPEIRPAPVLRSVTGSGLLRAAGDSKGDGDDEDDDNELHISQAPHAEKKLTENEDGTYKLALSVTGEADTTIMESVTKSNVLIVMDRSSSMVDNYVENGLSVTQVATTNNQGGSNNGFTPTSGTTYYGREQHNDKYRYFPLTYTNGVWYCENFSYVEGQYNPATKVYAEGTIYTGTVKSRMTEEQSALNDLIYQLLSKNMTGTLQDGTPLNDIIEVSVISFGSQRFEANNSETETRWLTDYDALIAAVNKPNATSGTNWEDALMYAKEIADAKKASQQDEEMYIIFLTDGEPTAIHGETTGAIHYNNTGGGFINAYKPATDDARALVDAGYHLYGIYTFNNIGADYLQRLIHVAYGEGQPTYADVWYDSLSQNVPVPTYPDTIDNTNLPDDLKQYFYDASNPSGLANAFQNILSTIANSVAFGQVSIVDGITTDAATTAVISGRAQGFRYSVSGAMGELYSVTTSGTESDPQVVFTVGTNTYSGDQVQKKTGADGKEYYSVTVGETEYKMALATIDNNKKVTWDLSALGALMGDYTYKVEFDVWPNQEAYDYVADLNNGVNNVTWNWDIATKPAGKNYWIGGVEEYPSIVCYSDGNGGYVYSVLTNTEQELTFSIVNTETVNGETHVTYSDPQTIKLDPPDPMPLLDTRMQLEKIWDDDLDDEQLDEILYDNERNPREYKINLLVWKADTRQALQTAIDDGTAIIQSYIENHSEESIANAIEASKATAGFYKNVIVGWDGTGYDWDKDFTVAPGLMVPLDHAIQMGETIIDANKVTYKGKLYYVLDQGHYYTISEPGIDRHYELNTQIYHPMIIDDELMQVTIENGEVVSSETLTQVNANNTLKGGINVHKVVKDVDGNEIKNTDDKFTITLRMFNKNGTPYTDYDYRIFYGENNPNYANMSDYPNHYTGHVFGTDAARPVDNDDPVVETREPPQGKCYIANTDTGEITFELYVGDWLRVINVPAGVKYYVEEDTTKLPLLPDATSSLYQFSEITYEIAEGNGTFESDTHNSDTPATYTVKGNSASRATVVNIIPSVPLRIFKIGEGNKEKPLEGIWFQLYYDAKGEHQILKDSIGRQLGVTKEDEDGTTYEGVIVTDENGDADLGRLIAGDYYLKEIKTKAGYVLPEGMIPITIAKNNNGTVYVSYNQAGNTLSLNGNGVTFHNENVPPESAYFAVTIDNPSTARLPNTGGPGTKMINLLGMMLTGFAGMGLVMKKRKRRAA